MNEIFPIDTAKHLDTRDVQCGYETDSNVEHGLECDKDDLDQKHKRLKQVKDIK